MAASRPMWKGQLRLSLVSINVEMFTAHKSGATTAFNQIHKPSGKRIHYQKVVDGIGAGSGIDILVNNAGGQFAAPAEKISQKGWEAVVSLNLNAVFAVTRACFAHLCRRRGV